MIHESRYWKIPLLRGATFLEKVVVTDENAESTLARAEREVFVGFYAVRKLLPTFKLSISTKGLTSHVTWFPSRLGQSVNYFHRSDVDELYDLDHPTEEKRDLAFLCNQVIHSYIFVNSTTDDGSLDGFFVSSDTMCRRRLYFFSLSTVVHVFRTVGRDYPTSGHYRVNDVTGEWEASASAL